jgi:muramoyltetrapeptide carboxypeptidase
MMKAQIPKALAQGGTVGIVAPASPYAAYSDVLRGIAWWESRGFHVRLAKGALERSDYVAGPPEKRAQDLMEMFSDPSVDAVQCLRGGIGSAEIIPHIDFQILSRNPKPFVGFSDITALHCAILRFAGWPTFYGPSLLTLGSSSLSSFTAGGFLRVLCGETTGPVPRNPDDPFVRALAPGRSSGPLVGGCLSDLMHTMGTPWEFDAEHAIFAFEEIGSSPHGVERALVQLMLAGKLRAVRGVVIGDLVGCEWSDGGGSPFPRTKVLEEVLEERLGSLGVPVLMGLPFGHGAHMATLPLGVEAVLDAEAGSLVLTEPALR